jgi:hypothetical protein
MQYDNNRQGHDAGDAGNRMLCKGKSHPQYNIIALHKDLDSTKHMVTDCLIYYIPPPTTHTQQHTSAHTHQPIAPAAEY